MDWEPVHDRTSLGVHLHLEDAIAALQFEMRGEFLTVVLEAGPTHETHALSPARALPMSTHAFDLLDKPGRTARPGPD